MVAVVSHEDTAPLPASSVNSAANRLVPEFFAPASPLQSILTELSTSIHSKRLTENVSPLDSILTKNRGVGVPLFVTRIELSPSLRHSKSLPFRSLHTPPALFCTREQSIFFSSNRLRTLACN